MPSDQDEADALFGSAPPASPFAAKPRAGAGVDHRGEMRVRANWPARVLLPDKPNHTLKYVEIDLPILPPR